MATRYVNLGEDSFETRRETSIAAWYVCDASRHPSQSHRHRTKEAKEGCQNLEETHTTPLPPALPTMENHWEINDNHLASNGVHSGGLCVFA